MDLTVVTIWLMIAMAAALVEVLSPLFGFIFGTPAALVAAGLALFLPLPAQIVAFAGTLLGSLLVVRPRLASRLNAKGLPTRTQMLIGKTGQVTVPIDPIAGHGRVLVAGEDWAATSDVPIPAGATVQVEGADGIVLHVYVV
jgi:membrane protein implicated in regulation of membrane protease activity